MSGISCLFNPGECVDSVVGAWLAWFPYGLTGFTFVCGMLVGAALGKWGVAAVLALVVAVKIGGGERAWKGGKPVENEDLWPHPDKPVKAKPKRPTLFGKR